MTATLRLVALITIVSVAGCSRPQLLLRDAGTVVLVKGRQTVELSRKNQLSIKWSSDGSAYTTQARMEGRDTPVTVQLIEANDQYLRVKSKAWKEPEQIPQTYLRSRGVRVIASSGRYKKPTLSIPLAHVEEITVHDRELTTADFSGYSRRNLVVGALGGMGVGGILVVESRDDYDDYVTDEEALIVVGIGTLTGALLYPTYKVFWPRFRQSPGAVYIIEEREGWRIEIRR